MDVYVQRKTEAVSVTFNPPSSQSLRFVYRKTIFPSFKPDFHSCWCFKLLFLICSFSFLLVVKHFDLLMAS